MMKTKPAPLPAAPAPTDILRAAVQSQTAAVVTLTALGLALGARATGRPLDPVVAAQTDAVLDHLGLAAAVRSATPSEVAPIAALVRAELLFAGQVLSENHDHRGWHARPDPVLQAFGAVSAGFPALLDRMILPKLPDLTGRLAAPGARFLDIGTGVAWLLIGMLRRWPGLHATGIEPLPQALALGQRNLADEGLQLRAQLRLGAGEMLEDSDCYDLVFVPSAFIDRGQIPEILRRARRALKPGGYLLLAVVEPPAEPLAAIHARFRAAVWGGAALGVNGGRALLSDAGLAGIEAHQQPSGYIAFLTAQRR